MLGNKVTEIGFVCGTDWQFVLPLLRHKGPLHVDCLLQERGQFCTQRVYKIYMILSLEFPLLRSVWLKKKTTNTKWHHLVSDLCSCSSSASPSPWAVWRVGLLMWLLWGTPEVSPPPPDCPLLRLLLGIPQPPTSVFLTPVEGADCWRIVWSFLCSWEKTTWN